MNRRRFLSMAGACLSIPNAYAGISPAPAALPSRPLVPDLSGAGKVLILIELKGGNDGLNTVIPFADPAYYTLRPTLNIARSRVLQLDERTGLHPAAKALMPLWSDGQLAIVQGVGYPRPNLSHFRSLEIWDTASRADQYLEEGWLARALRPASGARGLAAGAAVIGSVEMGPFTAFATFAAGANGAAGNAMRLSASSASDPVATATVRSAAQTVKTRFAAGAFGTSVGSAVRLLAGDTRPGVAVIRLTLNGFDTHQNQHARHAALLGELSEGCAALRSALGELGRWDDTLVVTYSEFGRHPRENQSRGTDHGTVAPHFVMGGRVRGGLFGAAPRLARLDGGGNLPAAVDFRQLYSTILGNWWGLDSASILHERFEPLPLLRT
jgi:uncharacterized protein (DUF1501 family)|nr:DUF1501 domain-containing protein [Paraburkholderia sp. BL8N3]